MAISREFSGATPVATLVPVAAELGALLRACTNIGIVRWRLDAIVRLAPAFARYGLPLDRVRAAIDANLRGALCGPALTEVVRGLLDDGLERAPAGVLAGLVAALFTRRQRTAALAIAPAAVYLRDDDALAHLRRRSRSPQIDALARRGCLCDHLTGWGGFAGDLRAPGAEEAFEPTLPLVGALVDAIIAGGDASRIAGAERAAGAVAPVARTRARAHLARLDLAFASAAVAERRIRSIRERGVRAGAGLLLVRAALELGRTDDAHRIASAIDASRFRQRAHLAIARWLAEQRRATREPLALLDGIADPVLAAERVVLRDELRVMMSGESAPELTPAMLRAAREAPAWTGATPIPPAVRAELASAAALIRRDRRAAFGRRWIPFAPAANRALLALLERLGVPAFEVVHRLRGQYGELRDALQAAALTLAAERAGNARRPGALAALCNDDPAMAAQLVLLGPLDAAADTHRALASIERGRGLPAGYLDAYARAETAVERAFGIGRGEAWLGGLVAGWRARHGGLPDATLLRAVVARRRLPADPARLLDILERAARGIDAPSHARLAVRAAFDGRVLSSLLVGRPAQLDPELAPWSRDRWRDLLRAAASAALVTADTSAVAACAARMRRDAHALLAGDLVRLGASPRTIAGIDARDHVVRLLDKRRDLLTYLRVGDVPARSAYRSDPARAGADELAIAAWRDPLTACFRVDRWHPEGLRPSGFVVGRLADRGDGAVVFACDDVHLQSRGRHARDVVLRAVGEMLAPAGIAAVTT